jgi:ribonuclease P protein component
MARAGYGQDGTGRFGLVTPKSIGKAHDRNRIKRRLRHIISLVPEILNKQDIVLLASTACIDASFEQLKNDVVNAGRQIKGRSERHSNSRNANRPSQTFIG